LHAISYKGKSNDRTRLGEQQVQPLNVLQRRHSVLCIISLYE